MKNVILIALFLVSMSFSREIYFDTKEAISVRSTQPSVFTEQQQTISNSSREDIVIFEWDFEEEGSWNHDAGWSWTDADYHSETHSYLTPNTDDTFNNVWNLTTDPVALPELGDGEIMRFKFWLYGDTPDTDGDGDNYLEDYYQISIMDLEALAWHASDNAPDSDGASYWCADEEIGPDGGYLDEWMQYLDTPATYVTTGAKLTADIRFEVEDEAGAVVGGSCTDGWDSCNIRISADGGSTWDLVEDPNYPYDFECGYGWIFNDGEYESGGSLNHLAPGWGGSSNGWVSLEVDLADYVDQEVIVRFAFGSDPAYNTFDQTDMTGFQVDNILLSDNSGEDYVDAGNGVWDDAEPFTDELNGQYDEGEAFEDTNGDGVWTDEERYTDTNGNGMYDDGEPFIDGDGDGVWDEAEPFTDGNGMYDEGEVFEDLNGDGIWTDAEQYTDENGNGMYDDGEPFVDEGNGMYDEGEEFTDDNGNGMWDSAAAFDDNADDSADNNTMAPSGEVWEGQFYDYCDSTRPGGNGWEEYVPGLAFNGNVLHDISHLAGKDVIIKIAARYDDNHDGGQGMGIYFDDFMIYKESSGNYPPPADLVAESGDMEAHLSWQDMNVSGTFDYDYSNGQMTNSIVMSGDFTSFAGEMFNIAGASTVDAVNIYNANSPGVTVTLAAFSKLGTLWDSEATYEMNVTLDSEGYNTIDLSDAGWTFESGFILAHSFNDLVAVALDETAVPSTNSMVLFEGGSWGTWADAAADSDGQVSDGEWLIGATITQSGANVTYNVQRDGVEVASDLGTNMHTDTGLTNNQTYTYTVSATYPDGTESDPSESVEVIPQAQTVHEEAHDDGTAESSWVPGGSNEFAAVKFEAHCLGEPVMRYKWYQMEEGGAFYIKIFADEDGLPGEELLSMVQVSGNIAGWNQRDLSTEGVDVAGDFWVGMKTFSSTEAVGLDTTSDAGFSMQDVGNGWESVAGNLMFRIDIDAGEEPPTDEECHLLSNSDDMPIEFNISNAYPNPFNPSTTLDIDIPDAGILNVDVYNLRGQLVTNLFNKSVYPGSYSLTWDASNVTSGLYIVSIGYNDKTSTQKIMLVK